MSSSIVAPLRKPAAITALLRRKREAAKRLHTMAASSLSADLIVLTTKGRTGLKRILLGSTAEQVMRHAACPVLSVRRR